VADLGTVQRTIGSSLTAVDLSGLTRLELAFAVLLVAGATGLVLALGLAERRRTFAILAALGATDRQLGAFLWSEGLMILVGGAAVGTAIGFGVAGMLVKLLTSLFDPPPQSLSIPWAYLVILAAAAMVFTAAAVLGAGIASRRSMVEALRDI
jgi:putative ABC transport system permease protein